MLIKNKKAKFKYKIFEKFEAGLLLTGAEVKAIKSGRVDITQSYAKIIGTDAFLINAVIQVLDGDPARTRKLLLHKKQIISIHSKIKAREMAFIPTKLYNKGRLIKVELALAKGKKTFEKRQSIKKKDIERELGRELRGEKQE